MSPQDQYCKQTKTKNRGLSVENITKEHIKINETTTLS